MHSLKLRLIILCFSASHTPVFIDITTEYNILLPSWRGAAPVRYLVITLLHSHVFVHGPEETRFRTRLTIESKYLFKTGYY